MELLYKEYGFYKIDKEYLKYLNSKDGQVFYKEEEGYDKKPHLGLIVGIDDCLYCIPLTSAKRRHLGWQNVSEHNYIIYEIIEVSERHRSDVCKKIDKEGKQYKKILSVLEIRKMIPVNYSVITKIEFDEIEDEDYKNLLQKEYRFLKPYKPDIIRKANELYEKQKETGVIKPCYVTFNILEQAYKDKFISE